MRIALIQLAVTDEPTLEERIAHAAALVREQRGADLVLLPELWHVGAFDFRRWEEAAESLDGQVVTAMSHAARDAEVVLHLGSVMERSEEPGPEGRHLWNTAVVLDRDGSVVTSYRKMHRFCKGKEPELIEAGTEPVAVGVASVAGETIGAGLVTCYDIRFPELFGSLLKAGVGMYLLPASWPMARLNHWRVLAQARAIENQAYVLACSAAGTHARQQMAGHSMVVAPDGTILAEAGEGEEVLTLDLDVDAVAQLREAFPVIPDRSL